MLGTIRGTEQSTHTSRLSALRAAQCRWAAVPLAKRLRLIRALRAAVAARASLLASAVDRDPAETLASEIVPWTAACRFLELEAGRILSPARPSPASRPIWLRGVDLEIRREPLGVVLLIGASNYPVFLAAVQATQALCAGNAVALKPGRGSTPAAHAVAACFSAAGFDPALLAILPEDPEAAHDAIAAGVDKVILTGSFETGQAVIPALARHATPSVMELSGEDPVIILDDADPVRVRKALAFARHLNGGNTCIAPRRIIVSRNFTEPVDVPLPVHTFDSDEQALELAAASPFALGASVFGSTARALEIARRVRAGAVTINDIIAPTADPRLPFGGRGRSGYGLTRGAEGLLEMTTIKAIATQRSRWLPHLEPRHSADARLFAAYLRAAHTRGWRERLSGWRDLIGAMMARRKENS